MVVIMVVTLLISSETTRQMLKNVNIFNNDIVRTLSELRDLIENVI